MGALAGQNSGCETSGWNGGKDELRGVRHPDGMAVERNSGCDTPGCNGGGEEFRV